WACADLPSGNTGGPAWGSCHRSSRVSFVELHPWPGRGSRAPARSSRDYEMRTYRLVMIAAALACGTSAMAGDIAPGRTLRAAYLVPNRAQAMGDPAPGQLRGPAYDLARELARRNNVPLEFKPIAGPPAVIEAVKNAEADIGFVAYEATRLGTVEFSQTYM